MKTRNQFRYHPSLNGEMVAVAADASTFYGISCATITRWIKAGRVATYGRYIKLADLEKCIQSGREAKKGRPQGAKNKPKKGGL